MLAIHSRMIGVAFGSKTMKLALVCGGQVKKMAVKNMPEDLVRDGRVNSPAAMASFLKEMLKENRIRGGCCALVLPSADVLGIPVSMPVMSDNHLKLNLPFEFRDYVGKDSAKYLYDYSVVNVRDEVMDLYAAAVRKEVVEQYATIARKAGLNMKVAVPQEMAWGNLLSECADMPEKLCIVDMGHSITRVNIYVNGHYVMGRDIGMGGALFDQAISHNLQIDLFSARIRKEANTDHVQSAEFLQNSYRKLSMEVMKVIRFFRYSDTTGTEPLKHLYYCGGSSLAEPLTSSLMQVTGMIPEPIDRLIGHQEIHRELLLHCAIAAGAALQK